MFLQFIFIFLVSLILIAMVVLMVVKAGLQLQYMRISKGRPAGEISDFVQFDYSSRAERSERWQAFLLFPLMYAVVLDDEKQELLAIKRRVKRIHIAIYSLLIILIILGVYSEKIFPQNAGA